MSTLCLMGIGINVVGGGGGGGLNFVLDDSGINVLDDSANQVKA